MKPKELIIQWVDAFNKGDADIIGEFYADNSINHQIANEPIEGKKSIIVGSILRIQPVDATHALKCSAGVS